MAKALTGIVDVRLSLETAKCAVCSTRFKLDTYTGCSVFIGTPRVIHYDGAGDVTILIIKPTRCTNSSNLFLE